MHTTCLGLLQWLSSEEFACKAGYMGCISWLGRPPGEGNGNPLQDSCLGNGLQSMGSQRVIHNLATKHTVYPLELLMPKSLWLETYA